jgi:hypothetical protein
MIKRLFLATVLLFLFFGPGYAADQVFINSQNVTVTNNMEDIGSGLGEMQYSVDNEQTWTAPEPYAVSKNLTLPNLDEGEHCVSAKFSDKIGNWTLPIQACAVVDTTPPTGKPEIQGVKINIAISIN